MRIWFYGDSWTRGDDASDKLNYTNSDLCEDKEEYPYQGAFPETIESELGIECINRGFSGASNMCILLRYLSDLKYHNETDFFVIGISHHQRMYSWDTLPGIYSQAIHVDWNSRNTHHTIYNHNRSLEIGRIQIRNKEFFKDDIRYIRSTKMVCDTLMHLQKRLLLWSAFTNFSTIVDDPDRIMFEILESPSYESFLNHHCAFEYLKSIGSTSAVKYWEGEKFTEIGHPNRIGYEMLGKYLALVISNKLRNS